MPYQIDLTDKKIIHEMDLDCRRPLSTIAKNVRISQQRLQYRLNKLEKDGIIPFYYTIVAASNLGYTFYRVMLRFQNTTTQKEQEIIEHLVKNPYSFWVATCSGRWDLVVDFMSRNVIEFDQLIQKFLEDYSNFISQKDIVTIVHSTQYVRSFFLKNSEHKEFKKSYGGALKEIPLDKIDKEILNIISNNPRMKNFDIARILKIDRNTVKNRINKMIKEGIIVGFRGWFEIQTVGYHSYVLILRVNKIKREIENKLLSFARTNSNIIYFNNILGDWDFEYDIETESEEDFHVLLTKIKNSLAEDIRDYEILKINRDFKLNYVPPL